MADFETKRIVNLPAESAPESGDVFAVDNESNGTKKLAVSYFTQELNKRIAKPEQNPNGEAGQTLRSNGDGTTDWGDAGLPTDEQTQTAVDNWLEEHPEATTTIQDGAITTKKIADGAVTEDKLSAALKLNSIKNYVTPEMYGATGDGVTDDSTAIQAASQNGVIIGNSDKTYYIGADCKLSNSIANINFIVDKSATISAEKDDLFIVNCTFKNNEFYPDTGRGFWILSVTGSKNIAIENCYFSKGVSAVYIDRCSDVKIRNNIFEDFRQYGLSAGGNGYGILLIETQNVIISNNFFRDVARHSIYISHDSTSTYCENILIDGNIFEWDSAVVGNTTGFEVTISIRPAKYITISNNLFLNMFAVCEFAVQEIYVGGTLTAACSQHVTINSNKGSFANHPRHSLTGVIFAPADETYSALVAVSDVVISNNVFTIEKGVFVCCNALNDVCIKNNVITFELKTDSHVFCAPSPKQNGLLKTIVFDGNRIEGAYTLFRISSVAQNVDELIIANNHIDVTALANCVSGTTFKEIKIINNDIVSEQDRTYFSSATVEEITLKCNTSNKRISLYLVATKVISTDPCFIGYGFNSSNPSDCVAGAIHTWYSGPIYIMGADGSWHMIT